MSSLRFKINLLKINSVLKRFQNMFCVNILIFKMNFLKGFYSLPLKELYKRGIVKVKQNRTVKRKIFAIEFFNIQQNAFNLNLLG